MSVQAQSVLTPQQQLEEAQKKLEEAKKAVEEAKQRAEAAKQKAAAEADEEKTEACQGLADRAFCMPGRWDRGGGCYRRHHPSGRCGAERSVRLCGGTWRGRERYGALTIVAGAAERGL